MAVRATRVHLVHQTMQGGIIMLGIWQSPSGGCAHFMRGWRHVTCCTRWRGTFPLWSITSRRESCLPGYHGETVSPVSLVVGVVGDFGENRKVCLRRLGERIL